MCSQIDENVQREIINHRSLRHPNIIRFKEVNDYAIRDTAVLIRVSVLGSSCGMMQRGCLSVCLSAVLQVILTPTHLAIVMEYASGGELFQRICNAGRFSEDEVSLSLLLANLALYFGQVSCDDTFVGCIC